jgi:hypothetical protein
MGDMFEAESEAGGVQIHIGEHMTPKEYEAAVVKLQQSSAGSSSGSEYSSGTIGNVRQDCEACISAQHGSITAHSDAQAAEQALATAESNLASAQGDLTNEEDELIRLQSIQTEALATETTAQQAEANLLQRIQNLNREYKKAQDDTKLAESNATTCTGHVTTQNNALPGFRDAVQQATNEVDTTKRTSVQETADAVSADNTARRLCIPFPNVQFGYPPPSAPPPSAPPPSAPPAPPGAPPPAVVEWKRPTAISDWSSSPCRGYQNTYVITNMIDGNLNTAWNSAGCRKPPRSYGYTVIFDMGRPVTATGVRLAGWRSVSHNPASVTWYACTSTRLSYNRVPSHCRRLGTYRRSQHNLGYQEHRNVFRTTSRYWAFNYPMWGSGGYQGYISEVGLYGANA